LCESQQKVAIYADEKNGSKRVGEGGKNCESWGKRERERVN